MSPLIDNHEGAPGVAAVSDKGGIDTRVSGRSTGAPIFRWTILALVSFIYMLVAADRANLGIAIPAIKGEFRISNAQAGLFATLLFSFSAAAQIPASFACRRYGVRYIMLFALALAAVSSYLVGTSTTTLDIKIYRSVLGIAEAFISVSCISTINHWFSFRERGTATGFYWGSTKIGPVICPPLAVLVLQNFGWRAIFQLFAVPVLLSALIWFFFVRNRPEESRYVSPRELELIRNPQPRRRKGTGRPAEVPHWIDWAIRLRPLPLIDTVGGVFRSWNLIGNTFAIIFIVGIFNVFLAWIPSYLLNAKHLSLTASGILSSTLFAGAVTGNFAGGWISDNLLGMRRKPLMMLCALFSAIALMCLIFVPANVFLLGCLLLVTGLVVGLGYAHFTIYPMNLTTREVFPVAFGALNTGAALAAGLFPFITGLILDHSSWNMVFVFLSASALICLGFLITIQEPAPDEP